MFRNLCRLFTLLLSVLLSTDSFAQGDVIRQQACDANPYHQTVDSLKQLYSSQGFSVLRETSIQMESEYEMPIVLPMNQGGLYQFIFIGDPTSRLYEVRMYDYSERQVVYKKTFGEMLMAILSVTPMCPSFLNII